MQSVPVDMFGSPDIKGLQRFLEHCRQTAIERQHAIVACITLPSDFLDPLAVLESVNELHTEHCYIERNSKHEAVACAEPVLKLEVSGDDRFQKAKAFIGEWSDHTIFVGDVSLPWAGPHFFSSIAFEEEKGDDASFIDASLQVFLPRWQVGWRGAQFSATANVVVDENTPISLLIEPIWRAHQRFTSFDFDPIDSDETGIPHASRCRILNQEHSESGYLTAVENALTAIHAGEFLKVVVSRELEIETETRFVPLDILNQLRKKHPDCFSFSYQNSKGESFIGASPERLICVKKGCFETEALAGSIERGDSARQDAYFSRQLLSSEKDRIEHGLVLEYIRQTLEKLGLKADASAVPEILQLSNIQHLKVPLKGELANGNHILDLVEALHPTPALGGYPKREALEKLRQLESNRRDRYGGLTGWINAFGEGEFSVNIRCARVSSNRAVLYAGAGIVADSEPKKELRETELKLIGMLPNFMNLN